MRIGPLFFAATFTALAAAAHAQVLVNDTFSDGERFTQALPDSAQWTYGAHNSTAGNAFTSLNVVDGKLLWDHTNNGANSFSSIWAHFTPGGSPLTLNIGETLRLTFDVSFSGGVFSTSANAFRWSLFNSNNNRVTTDFAGVNESGVSSGTTFSTWRGYEGLLPVNTAANPSADFLTRERTGTGPGLNTSANWTNLGGSSVPEPIFAEGRLTAARWNSPAPRTA